MELVAILRFIFLGLMGSLALMVLIWVQDQRIIKRLDKAIKLLGGDRLEK